MDNVKNDKQQHDGQSIPGYMDTFTRAMVQASMYPNTKRKEDKNFIAVYGYDKDIYIDSDSGWDNG